ncbi:LCP family protein [Streptomyces sp. NPDC054783]
MRLPGRAAERRTRRTSWSSGPTRADGTSTPGGGSKDGLGRSDTAFLLHAEGDHRHAFVMSIPGTRWPPFPPCRLSDGSWSAPRPDKSPEANPACTQNIIEKLTGLRVDHTVVVGFEAFANLTEAVGGWSVCVPQNLYQKDLDPDRATRGGLLSHQGIRTPTGEAAFGHVHVRQDIGDGTGIGCIK